MSLLEWGSSPWQATARRLTAGGHVVKQLTPAETVQRKLYQPAIDGARDSPWRRHSRNSRVASVTISGVQGVRSRDVLELAGNFCGPSGVASSSTSLLYVEFRLPLAEVVGPGWAARNLAGPV
jgi:hypothetical protein